MKARVNPSVEFGSRALDLDALGSCALPFDGAALTALTAAGRASRSPRAEVARG